MLDLGGSLFISRRRSTACWFASENELLDVMNKVRNAGVSVQVRAPSEILDENGFAVIGDYAYQVV
jgi:hypothetical protein